MKLRCHNVKPEFELIHIPKHRVEPGAISGNLDIATVLRLFQLDFFQDNFVQRVAVKCQRGVSVLRLGVGPLTTPLHSSCAPVR